MNRYEKANAAMWIDGYYDVRPVGDTPAAAFERAKAECLEHMRRALECTEAIDLEGFLDERFNPFSVDVAQVIVNLSGGVVQSVVATGPVKVHVIADGALTTHCVGRVDGSTAVAAHIAELTNR